MYFFERVVAQEPERYCRNIVNGKCLDGIFCDIFQGDPYRHTNKKHIDPRCENRSQDLVLKRKVDFWSNLLYAVFSFHVLLIALRSVYGSDSLIYTCCTHCRDYA